uniref:Uncharacterized protein n=1 Tax=Triticum urartu TaxID=4572 RepID=A0A8R7PC61_TRIUA
MDNGKVTYLKMWSLVEVTNSLVLFAIFFFYVRVIIRTRRFVRVTVLVFLSTAPLNALLLRIATAALLQVLHQ